MFFLKHGVE